MESTYCVAMLMETNPRVLHALGMRCITAQIAELEASTRAHDAAARQSEVASRMLEFQLAQAIEHAPFIDAQLALEVEKAELARDAAAAAVKELIAKANQRKLEEAQAVAANDTEERDAAWDAVNAQLKLYRDASAGVRFVMKPRIRSMLNALLKKETSNKKTRAARIAGILPA